MSIASEISRLQAAKADIKTAIEGKGVSVPGSAKIDTYPQYINNISGGGGDEEEYDTNPVKLYGWDGEVAYSYTAAEFLALEVMPANPEHTGFTAQGWNWTLADAKAYVVAHGALDIGQMYVTSDGVTRIHLDTRLIANPTRDFVLGFNQDKANGVTIDWGDGSATETIAQTGNNKTATHSYTSPGAYVISLTPDDDCTIVKLGWGSGYESLFGYCYNNGTQITLDAVTKVEIGARVLDLCVFGRINVKTCNFPDTLTRISLSRYVSVRSLIFPSSCTSIILSNSGDDCELIALSINNGIATLPNNAFAGCSKLKSITIPDTVTTMGVSVFQRCSSLRQLAISNAAQSFGNNFCNECYSLRNLTLPNTVTVINASAFAQCLSLEQSTLDIPNSVTTIARNAFEKAAASVTRINIGTGVTSIETNAFSAGYSTVTLEAIYVYATTPPTIQGTTFSGTGTCPIYVPQGTLATYQAASNWSAAAVSSRLVEMT